MQGKRKIGQILSGILLFTILGLMSGSIQIASAQSEEEKERILKETKVEKLKDLSKELDEKYKKEKEKALKIAKEKKWIIRKEFRDGSVIELQKLANWLKSL